MSISFVVYPAGDLLFLQSTGGCVRNISTLIELDQLAHHAPLHSRVELQERERVMKGLHLVLLSVPSSFG